MCNDEDDYKDVDEVEHALRTGELEDDVDASET
jgi:hypothetical protein